MKKRLLFLCLILALSLITVTAGIIDKRKELNAKSRTDSTEEVMATDKKDSDKSTGNIPRKSAQKGEPAIHKSDKTETNIKDETKAEMDEEPEDTEMVYILDFIPDIKVDLKYSTEDNFTGEIIYDFDKPLLRYGTVKKLSYAQVILREEGFRILIWDAYRPPEAQHKLWESCPDPTWVANPQNGYSSHSRGNAVDITIVTEDGSPVEMPSDFDEFGMTADRDYSDVSEMAAKNASQLEQIMLRCGFTPYYNEWWHFSDSVSYEVCFDGR